MAAGSEDCLFLNVWTPKLPHAGDGGKPVLFFIHGGANILGASNIGTGNVNTYDGQAIATREDAVVVTTNYRLGAFGFLAHPALSAQNANGLSGNYAILDLVQALRWVQHNIAAFGGDPKRVMVFGESAGGVNTCMMLTTPLASGLFSSALMESGFCSTLSRAAAEQQGSDFASKLGCPATARRCRRSSTRRRPSTICRAR
jgi:para-nitrobenzyl esterase